MVVLAVMSTVYVAAVVVVVTVDGSRVDATSMVDVVVVANVVVVGVVAGTVEVKVAVPVDLTVSYRVLICV